MSLNIFLRSTAILPDPIQCTGNLQFGEPGDSRPPELGNQSPRYRKDNGPFCIAHGSDRLRLNGEVDRWDTWAKLEQVITPWFRPRLDNSRSRLTTPHTPILKNISVPKWKIPMLGTNFSSCTCKNLAARRAGGHFANLHYFLGVLSHLVQQYRCKTIHTRL